MTQGNETVSYIHLRCQQFLLQYNHRAVGHSESDSDSTSPPPKASEHRGGEEGRLHLAVVLHVVLGPRVIDGGVDVLHDLAQGVRRLQRRVNATGPDVVLLAGRHHRLHRPPTETGLRFNDGEPPLDAHGVGHGIEKLLDQIGRQLLEPPHRQTTAETQAAILHVRQRLYKSRP